MSNRDGPLQIWVKNGHEAGEQPTVQRTPVAAQSLRPILFQISVGNVQIRLAVWVQIVPVKPCMAEPGENNDDPPRYRKSFQISFQIRRRAIIGRSITSTARDEGGQLSFSGSQPCSLGYGLTVTSRGSSTGSTLRESGEYGVRRIGLLSGSMSQVRRLG